MLTLRRLAIAGSALVAAAALALIPTAAQAHSLDSSTIAVRLGETSAEATISIALESLDAALGTDYAASTELTAAELDAITAYLDEHLSVVGADGTAWAESYGELVRSSVEGIDSVSVEVVFDTGGADASAFTIEYDAIIEADASHEAVVVLTDAAGEISTAGVIDASTSSLAIGDTVSTGLLDMVGYGFHHVLEGADHLLFLSALLLVAPLAAVARRWQPRASAARSLRGVIAVVTAFTLGHSLTLIASALGWISLPSQPVEVLVAASVAIAAVHAIRPLVAHGDEIIAGVFGLVHGLAFAGILSDLGLDGSLSILTLLAFNLGVELAQLATVALVVPSLLVLSRTRWYRPVRLVAALVALAAALLWMLDRLGVLANPFAAVEDAAVAHAWLAAVALAALAGLAWLVERRRGGWESRVNAAAAVEAAADSRNRGRLLHTYD